MPKRWRRTEKPLADELGVAVTIESRLPGEKLVREKAQAVDVGLRRHRVALHALRINRKVSILRTSEESAGAARFLDALAEEILGDATFPGRPLDGCLDCDFRRICPVYTSPDYPVIEE